MQQGDLNPVEINILGKTFPLKVTQEELAWIQILEEEINHKIMGIQETYPHRDKLDCVIMTLLTYAFENKHQCSVSNPAPDEKIEAKLDDILQMLSVH